MIGTRWHPRELVQKTPADLELRAYLRSSPQHPLSIR
jgi:hypothetical protein